MIEPTFRCPICRKALYINPEYVHGDLWTATARCARDPHFCLTVSHITERRASARLTRLLTKLTRKAPHP